jgi:hypothetical protein
MSTTDPAIPSQNKNNGQHGVWVAGSVLLIIFVL